MSAVTPERELVILASKGRLTSEDADRVAEIVHSWPDWKEIVYQATTHRVLGLLQHHCKQLDLLDWIERDLRNLLSLHHAAIGEKNRAYQGELQLIAGKLEEKGVRAALLKGPLLATTVYPGIETRYSNDLDFLVSLSDVNALTAALTEAGYVQGSVSPTGDIVPANRQQKIFHQMSTHELHEFLKPSGRPLVGLYAVDINHSILWGGKCPYVVDTAELIERSIRVEINGHPVWRLDYEDCLLQLCCHLYREATMAHWIEDSRDLKLYKFADILVYCAAHQDELDWGSFEARVKKAGLDAVVYYVFHHVLMLYASDPTSHLIGERAGRLRPQSLDYLDEYELQSGERRRWQHPFLERLFDTRRLTEVGGTGRKHDRFEAVKGDL